MTKFLLKEQNRIFLCPGFNPSTMDGMDLCKSAMENRISSLFTKSLYLISVSVWSKYVPGCHRSPNVKSCEQISVLSFSLLLQINFITSNCLSQFFLASIFFLLKANSIASPSSSLIHMKSFLCLAKFLKYSLPSFEVLVPRPCITQGMNGES